VGGGVGGGRDCGGERGWGGGSIGMHTERTLLDDLNLDPSLDARDLLNNYLQDDENISQFFQTNINSSYHDVQSFIHKYKHSTDPIILSLNVQSLNSKYAALKNLFQYVQGSGVPVDLIIVQETWEIRFLTQLGIPGFQNIVYRTREGGMGGGVGIYIREGLNFKARKDLETYKLRTFENLVIEVQYPNKNFLFSNIYRSPNPPPGLTVSEHLDSFLDTLDSHLSLLSDTNIPSYIFTDSNLNLLKLNTNTACTDYIDTLITNGFIQIISKATRIQNTRAALIDHIITNTNLLSYNAGTIIDDTSDHFINFLQLSHIKTAKLKIKESTKRQINEMNTNNLKAALRNADWTCSARDWE
jgi:hypothetical protein